MCFYLYKKTHNITGLQYLGQTIRDPYKYKGSGTYWKAHLKIHGHDVTTEVIGTYETHDQMKEAGTHYSKLWNVVASNQWANLIEECGDGWNGPRAPETKQRISQTMKGYKQSPEHIEKRRLGRLGSNHWTHRKGYNPACMAAMRAANAAKRLTSHV